MIEKAREDRRTQAAGLIGRFFHIDPLVVLNSDYMDWSIRMAAYQHAMKEEEAAQKKKK